MNQSRTFRLLSALLLPLALAFSDLPALAQIRLDTNAAHSTLSALGNKKLTRSEALGIADLPGNRALIRKVTDLGGKASRSAFADELMAASQGSELPKLFGFAALRSHRDQSLALITRIEADPINFRDWISARVSLFTPDGLKVSANGYLVAGGWADGFSFDEPEFYLDITKFGDDFGGARVIMAHELYHSIQNAAVAGMPGLVRDFKSASFKALKVGHDRDCYAARSIFSNLMEEGTATYVGDPALLPETGSYSAKTRSRYLDRKGGLRNRTTLLDMSLVAVTGSDPLFFDDVYAVDFYNEAPLYDLGYLMAKTIAENDGDKALAVLITENGEAFVKAYLAIADRPGSTLPQLGPVARRWAVCDCSPVKDEPYSLVP